MDTMSKIGDAVKARGRNNYRNHSRDSLSQLPIGPQVVPFYGFYFLESYKVIPKRNYLGAYMGILMYPPKPRSDDKAPKLLAFWPQTSQE